MKVRTGFISNSSSTSFIVAIPENIDKDNEPYIAIFEKIVDKLKVEKSHFGYGFVTPQDLIKDYDERIKDYKIELGEYEHFYNQVAEYMSNKNHVASVQLFLDIVTKEKDIDYLKYYTPKKHMSEIQSETQEFIKDVNKKLFDLEKEREQVILNSKGAKYIMSFTLDHWTSDIEKVLEIMIEKGIVKLVRKVES